MKQKVIFNLYKLARRHMFVVPQFVLVMALTSLAVFAQTPGPQTRKKLAAEAVVLNEQARTYES